MTAAACSTPPETLGSPTRSPDGGSRAGRADAGWVYLDGGDPEALPIQGPSRISARELSKLSQRYQVLPSADSKLRLSIAEAPEGLSLVDLGDGTATLEWTPRFDQAGDYRVLLQVDADDGRSSEAWVGISVDNAADPLLEPSGARTLNAVPVGDVDGDGLSDLASCEIDGLGQLKVRFVFGDRTGLPVLLPYPPNRTRVSHFASREGLTNAPSCTGGDFDGDGYSDLIWADEYGGAQGNGAIFVLYGGPRAQEPAPPAIIEVPDLINAYLVLVGDLDGDGRSELVVTQKQASFTRWVRISILWSRPGRSSEQTEWTPTEGTCSLDLYPRSIGDPSPQGQRALLIQDPDVGMPVGATNCGTDPSHPPHLLGGIQVLEGPWDQPRRTSYRHPISPDWTEPEFDQWWGIYSTLCDRDGDGANELLVLDVAPGPERVATLRSFPGGPNGLLLSSPIDLSQGAASLTLAAPNTGVSCVHDFFGPATLAVGSPSENRLNLMTGARLEVDRTILGESVGEWDFGTILAPGSGDFNGDGKQDLLVGARARNWVVYGE